MCIRDRFLSAVIFGVVAAVSFAASRPLAERFLGKEPETTPAPTITIERDEPGKEEETQTAESESLPPESQSEAAREEIEGIVKKELETFDWTRDKVAVSYTHLISINEFYVHMMETAQDEELKNYFEEKLKRARFIMNAVEQRRRTLEAVSYTHLFAGGIVAIFMVPVIHSIEDRRARARGEISL